VPGQGRENEAAKGEAGKSALSGEEGEEDAEEGASPQKNVRGYVFCPSLGR